jgi:hypothetical protein
MEPAVRWGDRADAAKDLPEGKTMSEQDEAEYIAENFGIPLSRALTIVQRRNKKKKRVDR